MKTRGIVGLVLALWAAAGATAGAATVLDCRFDQDKDMAGWNLRLAEAAVRPLPEGGRALRIHRPERIPAKQGIAGISRVLPKDAVDGRRLRIRAEFKGENIALPEAAWNGVKFQLHWRGADGKDRYPQGRVSRGDFGWETASFDVALPAGVKSAVLSLGLQDSSGALWIRNLRVETLDEVALDFAAVANRGLKDEVEGDGRGGWSDQGPDNDGAGFPHERRLFANVPFTPLDPAANGGKAVAVFKSVRFPQGLASAAFDLKAGGRRGRYLYLLHTACYGAPAGEPVGFVESTGPDGAVRTLDIESGRDVADWWNPKALANGALGATWTTAAGGRVAMYVSRFDLGADAPAPERLVLRPAADSPSLWIVAAATLSDTAYAFPGADRVVVRADAVWKPLQRPADPAIRPGSALDRSAFLPPGPAGTRGRVIANADGHLAFASEPARAVRFLSSCDNGESWSGRQGMAPPQLDTHENIERYARELRANGYDMTRLHFLDGYLMGGKAAKAEGGFVPERLDNFFYYLHCLKRNGIYVNLDAMSRVTGYSPVWEWSPEGVRMTKEGYGFKFAIHFDEKIRENWINGVERILTQVNPYTGTKLAGDPMLALVVGFNEQEFAFFRVPTDPGPAATARWRDWLRQRYPDFAALRKAWGDDAPEGAADFADLSFFTQADKRKPSAKGDDIRRFMRAVELATADWYKAELRRMGYDGLVSAYNMTKNWHYAGLRGALDAVTMNAYHAHPSSYTNPGSTLSQGSSIGGFAAVFRDIMNSRVAGKPFLVTEYANVFWNRYRYEQAFVTAGYGAFQGLDALTAYAMPVNIAPAERIHPFTIMHDPVLRAEEFLSFFLFRRGDVRPADAGIRIVADRDGLDAGRAWNDGLSSRQSKLCLTTGFSLTVTGAGTAPFSARPREVLVSRVGGGRTLVDEAGFAAVADAVAGDAFEPDTLIADLKRRHLLPVNNRTSLADDLYESSTGELYLDARKRFMSIATPRLQGVCGTAGITAALGALRVDEMTVKGNLALVSVDGDKPLAEAERMVLVFATDALNDGMVFDDPERRVLRDIGHNPTLVETGRFTVTVRHPRAGELRLWALDLAGARGAEITGGEGDAGTAVFTVDTGTLPRGPALFFEMAVN